MIVKDEGMVGSQVNIDKSFANHSDDGDIITFKNTKQVLIRDNGKDENVIQDFTEYQVYRQSNH